MSSIRTTVGLISGLNFGELTDALISLQRASVDRLEARAQSFQSVNTGLQTLAANLLPLTTSAQSFAASGTFQGLSVNNSKPDALQVSTTKGAAPGAYQLQPLRRASAHQVISSGFANSDQQAVGQGTLTIAQGGRLNPSTLLEVLNNGQGVRRGTLHITDRRGQSADVDLTAAITVDDVLEAINDLTSVSVEASTRDGRIVITDTSGSTASNLIVADVGSGHAAQDLGIVDSVAANTLLGDSILQVTGDFSLDQINDGNGIRLLGGAPDIRITLTDDSTIEVNLDGVNSLNDVVEAINEHEDNAGKVSASVADGRLMLSDLTGGGGTSAFKIEDINGSSVVQPLGLDVDASGGTITGHRLVAGLNSVLLRNLRGGQGIDQQGILSLTDRTGATAQIDLSSAESLDEVLNAINEAETSGGTKLKLSARVNSLGTGIEVRDTSGATAGSLTIADVGGSTLAAQLGIAVDGAQDSIDSGSLQLRFVNEGTSVANYAPDGGGIKAGSIRIVDSSGVAAVVSITTAVKNIGDVIQRINAAANISVTATLNETGDGFVLTDEAGGTNALRVEEVSGKTAASLRILGEGTLGTDGKYRLDSRLATIVNVESGDTLDDVVEKINAAGGAVTASVFDDHSAVNPKRLSLTSKTTGSAGELLIDDGDLGLGLTTFVGAEDALLRIGSNPQTALLVTSSTNEFANTVGGLNVTVKDVSSTPVSVAVTRNAAPVRTAISSFVNGYNGFVSIAGELTQFDAEANTKGVLQGEGIVLRISDRLSGIINRNFGDAGSEVRSLADMGIRLGEGGKLVVNEDRLNEVLANNPDEVADFFLDADNGFAHVLDQALDSFTDPRTGSLALQSNSIKTSVDTLNSRVEQLDALLDRRRERMLQQFSNMEAILGDLTSQQNALLGISRLDINPAPRGVSSS